MFSVLIKLETLEGPWFHLSAITQNLDHPVLLALLENLVLFLQIWVETVIPRITCLLTQECMDWESLRFGD